MPYLGLDEESTYIVVTCDGYSIRSYSSAYSPDGIFMAGTLVARFDCNFYHDGTNYVNGGSSTSSLTILEDTPIRSSYIQTYASPFTGCDAYSYLYVIYPDRFTVTVILDVNSTTFDITGYSKSNKIIAFEDTALSTPSVVTGTTSESVVSSDVSDGSYNYAAILSDELNIIGVDLGATTNTAAWKQIIDISDNKITWSWTATTTMVEGTHKGTVLFIIDSAERAHGSKLYDSSDRLEQGIQYTSPSELTITTGTAVTSGAGVTSIGTKGFGSDGCYHIDPDDDEAVLELGQVEHKPVISIHDFPYKTGSTDYLTFHDKMDDVSNNHTPAVGSTVAVNNTPEIDGTGVYFGDSTYDNFNITCGTNILYNKGCIKFKISDTSQNTFTSIRYFFLVDGGGYIYSRFNTAKRFYLRYGSISVEINCTDLVDSNAPLDITCNWTYDETTAWLQLQINDKIISTSGASTLTTWATSTMYIGSYRSVNGLSCLATIEDFKIFNQPILPYGAFFTGNSGTTQLADGMAHKDILFYWDCSATPTTDDGGAGGVTPQIGDVTCYRKNTNLTVEAAINGDGLTQSNSTWRYPYLTNTDTKSVVPADKGSISLWVKRNPSYVGHGNLMDIFSLNASITTSNLRFWFNQSNNYIYLSVYDSSGLLLSINSGGATVLGDGNWHYVKATYDKVGVLSIIMDGGLIASGTATAWSDIVWGGELRITGLYSFGSFDEVYITNNPNTPQIPTANGVPLDVPIVRND